MKSKMKNKISQNKTWRIRLPNSTKYIFRPSKTFDYTLIKYLGANRSQTYKYIIKQHMEVKGTHSIHPIT